MTTLCAAMPCGCICVRYADTHADIVTQTHVHKLFIVLLCLVLLAVGGIAAGRGM